MKRVLPNQILLSRWLIIIGVMFGLIFSSGEGVQLLPFSTSAKENREISSKLEIGKSKFYSYSVHNTFSFSSIAKTKAQKNSKELNYIISNNIDNFGEIRFLGKRIIYNYSQPILSNNSVVTVIPSDRAPPLV